MTPHSMTNISPVERLMKRKLRTRFDAMFPLENKVIEPGSDKEKIDEKVCIIQSMRYSSAVEAWTYLDLGED